MLILNRRVGERIVLFLDEARTQKVEVVVMDCNYGGRVQIGVEADPSILILREELLREGRSERV